MSKASMIVAGDLDNILEQARAYVSRYKADNIATTLSV